MKDALQTTGKDNLRNSQLAFSVISNIVDAIFKHGGVSEPAGILVTSIVESTTSSLFSKTGWSLVYQKVAGLSMLLEKNQIKDNFKHIHFEKFIKNSQSKWIWNELETTKKT